MLQVPYSFAEIARLTGATVFQAPPDDQKTLRHYLYDTRLCETPADALFFALKGSRDGHKFLKAAYALGIRHFCVADPTDLAEFADAGVLLATDPLAVLQALAAAHRQTFNYPVVGITGSNGKTIVKEWLADLLEDRLSFVKSPQSFNSQLGAAVSVLLAEPDRQLAIFEAGISKTGEMQALEKMIRPTIGVFTHFGDAHDAGFESRAEKLKEKFELFKNAAIILAFGDQPDVNAQLRESGRPFLTIGKGGNNGYRVENDRIEGKKRLFSVSDGKEIQNFVLNLTDAASFENALTAILVARYLGVDWADMAERAAQLRPIGMRTETLTQNPEITIINDCYSADLASTENALALLKSANQQPRRCVILTDMEHAGADSRNLQNKLSARLIQDFGVENVYLIGANYIRLAYRYGYLAYPTTEAFLADFDYERFRLSTVLVKGARRFELERVLPYLSLQGNATVFQVDLNALKQNVQAFRSVLKPDAQLMCMLKAAAYGSGSVPLARELARDGVEYFGVAYTTEGVELRKNGVETPIMVMNPDENALKMLFDYRLEPAVGSFRLLERLALVADGFAENPLNIHLEFDTGMARLGFQPEQTEAVLTALSKAPQLNPAFAMTHLASSEDPYDDDFTRNQLDAIQTIRAQIAVAFPEIKLHALNSAGIVRFPNQQFDLVRLGVGLYGFSPVNEMQALLSEIGSLRSVLSQIHDYPAGASISYNRAAVLERPTRVGVVPLGYADGLPRSLSLGKISFLVRGKLCPTIGRICMDMTMIDLTNAPDAEEGDEIVVFGRQNEAFQSVNAVAEAADTIVYEILARIPSRVRRVYIKE